jgi:hypothetical protein
LDAVLFEDHTDDFRHAEVLEESVVCPLMFQE